MTWKEKYKTKKGIRYRVRWREGGKKKHKKAGMFAATAIDIQDKVEQGQVLEDAELLDKTRTVKDLKAAYMEHCEQVERNIKTLSHVKYSLSFIPQKTLEKSIVFTVREDLVDIREGLLRSHNVNGTNMIMSSICACFNYALDRGWIGKTITKKIQLEGKLVYRFLKKKEIYLLLNEGMKHNKELRQLAEIALNSGMREGEILGLVDYPIINWRAHLPRRKRSRERIVPIRRNIRKYFKNKGWLLAWNKDRIGRALRRAAKRINLGRVRFHDFRHTFCSNYLQSGGTVADLREIVGHLSLKTLQLYAHFQKNYLDKRIEKMRFH